MTSPLYNRLSRAEQADYIAHLIIAVQHNDLCYKQGLQAIALAEVQGVYEHAQPGNDKAALHDVDNPIENGVSGYRGDEVPGYKLTVHELGGMIGRAGMTSI